VKLTVEQLVAQRSAALMEEHPIALTAKNLAVLMVNHLAARMAKHRLVNHSVALMVKRSLVALTVKHS
jgi:hypothetical protein